MKWKKVFAGNTLYNSYENPMNCMGISIMKMLQKIMVRNHDNPLEIHGKLSWKFHIQFMYQWKWGYG